MFLPIFLAWKGYRCALDVEGEEGEVRLDGSFDAHNAVRMQLG